VNVEKVISKIALSNVIYLNPIGSVVLVLELVLRWHSNVVADFHVFVDYDFGCLVVVENSFDLDG